MYVYIHYMSMHLCVCVLYERKEREGQRERIYVEHKTDWIMLTLLSDISDIAKNLMVEITGVLFCVLCVCVCVFQYAWHTQMDQFIPPETDFLI